MGYILCLGQQKLISPEPEAEEAEEAEEVCGILHILHHLFPHLLVVDGNVCFRF